MCFSFSVEHTIANEKKSYYGILSENVLFSKGRILKYKIQSIRWRWILYRKKCWPFRPVFQPCRARAEWVGVGVVVVEFHENDFDETPNLNGEGLYPERLVFSWYPINGDRPLYVYQVETRTGKTEIKRVKWYQQLINVDLQIVNAEGPRCFLNKYLRACVRAYHTTYCILCISL